MAKILKGAEELAGEPILAGAIVQPPGSLGSGSTGGGLLGAATAAALEKRDRGKHEAVERTSPLSDQGYLAITGTRLLLMKVKVGFTVKASELVTEVPRSQVVGASFEKAILSSAVVEFADGTAWHFSVVKINAGKAKNLLDILAPG